ARPTQARPAAASQPAAGPSQAGWPAGRQRRPHPGDGDGWTTGAGRGGPSSGRSACLASPPETAGRWLAPIDQGGEAAACQEVVHQVDVVGVDRRRLAESFLVGWTELAVRAL